eukprot:m.37731 g.37731  ORF g.37731 m.37731 type:complete len:916 (+) comp6757_c0_seq1:97-2844(+)
MLMFLVDEGRNVEVEIVDGMRLVDLHLAMEKACADASPTHPINHGALLVLDMHGRPLHEDAQGFVTINFDEAPLFLFNVMAVLDQKQSRPYLEYERCMEMPDIHLLSQEPHRVGEFILELNNDRQRMLSTSQSLVQDLIHQEKGFHAAYKSITALNNALAEQCAILDQKAVPFVEEFDKLVPILDKLKEMLLQIRIKPSYVGMEGDTLAPLLSLHGEVSTHEKYTSLVAKTKTAADKVRRLCSRYNSEVAASVQPFRNIGLIDKFRYERKRLTQQMEALFTQHRKHLSKIISMNIPTVESVLQELAQRHLNIKAQIDHLLTLKKALCGSTTMILGEVLALEQARQTFFKKYDLKIHSLTVNYLSRGVRALQQLRWLPYTYFQVTTEFFRRSYIKNRHMKAMSTISETVNNMRQSELDIRSSFVTEDLMSRVPSSWHVFPLLSDYPHSCLRRPRPFDEGLPTIPASEITGWLDRTEEIVKELGIENLILDDAWRDLRAQDVAHFELEYLKTIQPLEKGIDKATQELCDDPELFRLRAYAMRLEEEIVTLNLEIYINKFVISKRDLGMNDVLAMVGKQAQHLHPTSPIGNTRVSTPRKMSVGHVLDITPLSTGVAKSAPPTPRALTGVSFNALLAKANLQPKTDTVMDGLQKMLEREEQIQMKQQVKQPQQQNESTKQIGTLELRKKLNKKTLEGGSRQHWEIPFNISDDDNDDNDNDVVSEGEDVEDDDAEKPSVDDDSTTRGEFAISSNAESTENLMKELQRAKDEIQALNDAIQALQEESKLMEMSLLNQSGLGGKMDKSFMLNAVEIPEESTTQLPTKTHGGIAYKRFSEGDVALFIAFNGGLSAYSEGTLLHLVTPEECHRIGVIAKLSRKPKKTFMKTLRITSLTRTNAEEGNAFGLPPKTPFVACTVDKA